MKKLLFVAIATTFSLVACGPSAEEIAAKAKAAADSVAAVVAAQAEAEAAKVQAAADSVANVAKMEAEKVAAEAAAAAEAANAKKPAPKKIVPKTTEQKINQEAKKATNGRG
jgi:translation initiation factor IF-2